MTKQPINSYSPERALSWLKENIEDFEIEQIDWDIDLNTAGSGGEACLELYNDSDECLEYQIVEMPVWQIEQMTSQGIELTSRRSAATISMVRPKTAVKVAGIL